MRLEVIDMQTMPRPASDNTFQVAFKVPETWIDTADKIAALMSRPGITTTRTDALRAALIRGLDSLEAELAPATGKSRKGKVST
jgi:hypothetical protein